MGLLHGTCIEVDGAGVILRGPSGSGKSDLALRLMDEGARLVADDQIQTNVQSHRLLAAAPDTIDGLIEVRGIGVISVPSMASVEVELVIDLLPPESVQRMPEPSYVEIEGIQLPLFFMTPFEQSATAKLRLAVRAVRHDIVRNG
ncbi:MAG: serine/threonine protein kinase [Rhodospirillales bacterium]|nr:serine/threonine protein kinase [Rhodospirillales bacterium]